MKHQFSLPPIEEKWQKRWEESGVFQVDLAKAKNPYYSLVMFPYPSGDKLHVGHWYNFAPADSYARFMRMQGHDVFEPMGFDAFGLPAENYAVKTGIHPDTSTRKNVETMITQLKSMGCMYDWSKTLNTSEAGYYTWTQWLFLQMYKNGLAYKKLGNVNFCPSCQTVLANEQVWEGKCERCESDVVQKPLEQWYWKITNYSQRLLDGLKNLEWPEKTKVMQRNWIGRSEGVTLKQKIKDLNIPVDSYDSVPQTFMAQTFAVIAPEHPLISTLVQGTVHEKEVLAFVEKIKKKKAAKRFDVEADMEGVFTGRYIDNPFGTGDLPLWVASFVVMDYGTGIVNSSAHDERDFAFAKKYGIPLRPVMFPEDPKEAEKVRKLDYCYFKDPEAIMEQPAEFKGRRWGEVRSDIIAHMVKKGYAEKAVNYRLRDWLLSRQRYWGAPIPIVYDPEGKPHPVPEEHLPWLLPTDVEFKPTGKSPLFYSQEFKERTEKIFGKGWTPEFDTMDTFVCSSFYYLRYLMQDLSQEKHQIPNPKSQTIPNSQFQIPNSQFADPALEKKWLPVSMYIGGPEHACMHLIYARFVMMALHDFGIVSHDEPFQRLIHQGLITNKGTKMSKSKGNVVSPDGFVEKFGSDVFRMYLMFMGPFTDGGDWSDTGIKGMVRFVDRIHAFFTNPDCVTSSSSERAEERIEKRLLHQTIKKVTEDITKMHFNTALSALMIFLNKAEEVGSVSKDAAIVFVKLLSPLAPHLAEELWEVLSSSEDPELVEGAESRGLSTHPPSADSVEESFVINQPWPTFDAALTKEDTITIAIQVNGKLRGEISVPAETGEKEILKKAKEVENVKKYLTHAPKKEIYVQRKLVSFVV
jgi:leucyl-tRNA synthetase